MEKQCEGVRPPFFRIEGRSIKFLTFVAPGLFEPEGEVTVCCNGYTVGSKRMSWHPLYGPFNYEFITFAGCCPDHVVFYGIAEISIPEEPRGSCFLSGVLVVNGVGSGVFQIPTL